MRRWWVVGEEERRPGQRHRAADSRQRRAEERWQPAAAGRQMPAAGLTRWAQRAQLVQGVGRSARTSRISRQSGCPGRDRPRGAPRPGLTCSCRRGQQSCGAAVAGAHLLRRSRARGGLSWCSTVGCPCEAAGGPAGGIEHLLAAPSAISERPLHSRARQRRRRNARHLLRRFLCYKRACRTARGHGYGWLINLPSAAPQ